MMSHKSIPAPKKKMAADASKGRRIDPMDTHVGLRLKMRRASIGMSLNRLGQESGISFQQIQKYENGINRISASRLYQFSKILKVSIAYFFEDETASDASSGAGDEALLNNESGYGGLYHRETMALVQAYYKIRDFDRRRKVYSLIMSLADDAAPKADS